MKDKYRDRTQYFKERYAYRKGKYFKCHSDRKVNKGIKICTNCKKGKPETDFYFNKVNNIFYSFCKECQRKKIAIRERLNYNVKKAREKYLKQIKSGESAENSRRMKKKYPERFKARGIFREAIKTGLIKRQPCVICGEEKSEGHHEDYSKPLKVVWLCGKHHRILHRKYK